MCRTVTAELHQVCMPCRGRYILQCICKGLIYLHKMNIVHLVSHPTSMSILSAYSCAWL